MALTYWGDLDTSKVTERTIDNVSVVEILEDLNEDMAFYDQMRTQFMDALTAPTDRTEIIMNRYISNPVPYAEGSRPPAREAQDQFLQQIGFFEYQDAITITSRAARVMTAEQIAAIVNAKMTGLEARRFSDMRQAAFNNTTRTVIDGNGEFQVQMKPFYNGGGLADLVPVPGYTFQAGDDQHYTAAATANTLTPAEVRTKLIDKVRHHGYATIELHENPFDYYLENLGTGIYTPAANQIGSNMEANTGPSGTGANTLSLYDGLVGYVYNSPVIKSLMVPPGYLMAVGRGGTAYGMPFWRRLHPLGLDGLQLDVKVEKFPLENTVMTDGWGFAPYNRGGVAIMQVTATSYSIPANL